MGIEADWLFGQQRGRPTLKVLADLYKLKNNRVSHTLAHLAERDGQVAGLLLAYHGGLLSRLNWLTGWCLLKIWGLPATLRLAHLQSAYGDLKETEADEFYISNLAVFPDFEGRGIGTYSVRLFVEHCLGGEVGFVSDAAAGTVFVGHGLPQNRRGAGSGSRRYSDRQPEPGRL